MMRVSVTSGGVSRKQKLIATICHQVAAMSWAFAFSDGNPCPPPFPCAFQSAPVCRIVPDWLVIVFRRSLLPGVATFDNRLVSLRVGGYWGDATDGHSSLCAEWISSDTVLFVDSLYSVFGSSWSGSSVLSSIA